MLIPETSQTLDSQRTTSALRSILFSTGSTHPKLTMATDKRETAITLSDYESSKAIQYCHPMSCFLLLIYLLRGTHQIHQPPKWRQLLPAALLLPFPSRHHLWKGEHGVRSRGLWHLFPALLDGWIIPGPLSKWWDLKMFIWMLFAFGLEDEPVDQFFEICFFQPTATKVDNPR